MDLTPMLIGGDWRPAVETGRTENVTSPYDGSVVGTVPVAGTEDVEAALTAAEAGAVRWRRTPAHERDEEPAAGGRARGRASRERDIAKDH